MYRVAENSLHTSASRNAVIVPNNSFKSVADFVEDNLVVPKLLYFGLNVVIYSTHSFLFRYVRSYWFISKNEYSLTNLAQFTNIAGSFFFSRLADRTGKYRLILAGCVAAYCICMCLLLFPVMLPTNHQSIINYSENTIADDPYKVDRLRVYLLINAACFFFTSGTFPLLDSMVIKKLSSSPNHSKTFFGRQRLWGPLGLYVIGIIVPMLYDRTGKDARIIFPTLIVSSILFIIFIFVAIPDDSNFEAASSQDQHRGQDNSDYNRFPARPFVDSRADPTAKSHPTTSNLITSPGFFFLLLSVFVAGFIRAILLLNQSSFIINTLSFPPGLVLSFPFLIRVLPEVFCYFFSKEIIEWFGIHWVLVFGNLFGVLRILGYSLIPSYRVSDNFSSPLQDFDSIYALECLKGANASLVITSAALIASEIAPEGMASTAQGLVSGSWQGLSMSLAAFLGYLVNDSPEIPISGIFTRISIVGGIYVILMVCKFALIDRVIFTSSRKFID